MNYKVLLIDDQINDRSIQDFMLNAKLSNIDIVPCAYHADGMALLLRDDKYEFDAIILDATGFENEADNELDNTGLRYSLKKIQEMQPSRIIPWFVFTGASRNSTSEFKKEIAAHQQTYKFGASDLIFYTKSTDEERLLSDIDIEIRNIRDTEIYFRFKPLFKAIENSKELHKHHETLISIIKNMEHGADFNSIRKILESLFVELSTLSILPEELVKGKGWFNGVSRFLSNCHNNYTIKETIIHPLMADSVFRLVRIVQDASHLEGSLTLKVEDYIRDNDVGYFSKSTAYLFLEVLTYFGLFIQRNQVIQVNRKRWQVIDS